MQASLLSLLLSLCMLFSSTGGSIKTNSNLSSFTTHGELSVTLKADIDEETKEDMKPFNLQSVLNALSDFKMVWDCDVILDKANYESVSSASIEAPDLNFTSRVYQNVAD